MTIHASILALACLALVSAALADDLARQPTWSAPTAATVKAELDAWLLTKSLDEAKRAEIDALWPAEMNDLSPGELLEQTVTTLAAVEPAAKEVVAFCRAPRVTGALPEFKILADESQPAVVRHNLKLLYGSWLAQHDMHEEALEQFGTLAPADVVDPAALLFYQSVCHHRLRDKDKCLPAIAKLLENEPVVPRRFRELAKLMQADLEPLKPDTLDEVARLMDSVRRRLDLGRVGARVRKEEDDVIAKLDKMIEDLEKQRQEQEAQAKPMPGDPSQPVKPADDSKPGGIRGPGNVDPKDLANRGNWGNLPPKARQEALQQISKELPAHYRETIEEYFRKLAREGVK